LGAYNTSKYVLEAIAQSLRDELASYNSGITTIMQGLIKQILTIECKRVLHNSTEAKNILLKRKLLKKTTKELLDNQFDPQEMIYLMVDIIPKDSHEFRTVLPNEFEDMRKKYATNQYELMCIEKISSKK